MKITLIDVVSIGFLSTAFTGVIEDSIREYKLKTPVSYDYVLFSQVLVAVFSLMIVIENHNLIRFETLTIEQFIMLNVGAFMVWAFIMRINNELRVYNAMTYAMVSASFTSIFYYFK